MSDCAVPCTFNCEQTVLNFFTNLSSFLFSPIFSAYFISEFPVMVNGCYSSLSYLDLDFLLFVLNLLGARDELNDL